jgi:hypothetical protein
VNLPESDDARTDLPSDIFTDPRLSFAAKGVLALIHTYDNRHGLTAESLAQESRDGLSAVRSALRELENQGYLRRVRDRRPNGTLGPATYLLADDVPSAEHDNSGYAYAIASQPAALVKIGCSRNVRDRLAGLQTGSPAKLNVIWMAPGGRALEAHLHDAFSARRVRGEWFDFAGLNAAALIQAAADHFGGPR